MLKKELEIIEKLKSQAEIAQKYQHLTLSPAIQTAMKIVNQHNENLIAIHEVNRKIQEMVAPLKSSIEQVTKYHLEIQYTFQNSPLFEIIEKNRKLVDSLEKNKFFISIWNTSPLDVTPENEEEIQVEVTEFVEQFQEINEQIPKEEIRAEFPVDELLEEVNKNSESPISEEMLLNAFRFLMISTKTTSENIYNKAFELLEDLGKFSKTDVGAGLFTFLGLLSLILSI